MFLPCPKRTGPWLFAACLYRPAAHSTFGALRVRIRPPLQCAANSRVQPVRSRRTAVALTTWYARIEACVRRSFGTNHPQYYQNIPFSGKRPAPACGSPVGVRNGPEGWLLRRF